LASSPFATLIVFSLLGMVRLIRNPCKEFTT
jgi:hypothetical protein